MYRYCKKGEDESSDDSTSDDEREEDDDLGEITGDNEPAGENVWQISRHLTFFYIIFDSLLNCNSIVDISTCTKKY